MTRTLVVRAAVLAVVGAVLLASTALADTCCANLPVGLDPREADPGDTVRVSGLECRNADNSGPRPLALGAYRLAEGERAAEDPGDQPGPANPGPGPADFPPVEAWLPFASVPDPGLASGDATIVVPDLPDGSYQFWWWCDQDGPGGGIHYSTGPRLTIGDLPDTTTESAPSEPSPPSLWFAGLAIASGVIALVAVLRRSDRRGPGRT